MFSFNGDIVLPDNHSDKKKQPKAITVFLAHTASLLGQISWRDNDEKK